MKLTKILMCAVAAGAMAFVSSNAQAVVIGNDLYTPINIKATFSYVASAGKIKQASLTSKQILAYEGYGSGTALVVGPDNDIYAVDTKNQVVLDDLSFEGYFYFYPNDYVDTSTYGVSGTYKSYEAGVLSLDFYSDANFGIPDENNYSFVCTGNYTNNETDTVDNSALIFTKTITFSSKNLGGWGYDFDWSDIALPVSGSASGNASGKLVD